MVDLIIVFIAGTLIGSFLNVVIYRVPIGRSIVAPRSCCPFCERQIRWHDNIPILSFLLLKGRCRDCGSPIPLRYPLVEMVTGLCCAAVYYHFGQGPHFWVYGILTCALIAVVAIDIEHQEIPDVISVPGTILGVFLVTVFRIGGSTYPLAFLNSALGIISGAGAMFAMGFVGELIFRKEALGGGDVKLMAMIGAFLGWKLALLTFFLAPVLGAGVGIFMKLRFGKEVIPYGPYISLGAFISLFYGGAIIDYLFFRPV